MQYDKGTLIEKVRRTIEIAMRAGQISLEDSARLRRRYEQGLQEYTYLTRDGVTRREKPQVAGQRAVGGFGGSASKLLERDRPRC